MADAKFPLTVLSAIGAYGAPPLMIVETSDNRLFSVRDAGENYPQAWLGSEVRRTRRDGFRPKAKAREILIRKAGCRVVMAPVADPFARIA